MSGTRGRLLALWLVIAAAGCTQDVQAPPASTSTSASCEPRLDQAFRAWEKAGFSGAVVISEAGRFRCLAGYGYADDVTRRPNTVETVFSIGSVTKAFTAVSVLDLVEAGRLSLETRVRTVLPEVTGPVGEATVRQLLLHTSGLRGSIGADHRPLGRDAAVKAVNRLELAHPPGSRYLYSNAGYTLLALMIEKVSGMTYREYTASRTLRLPGGGGRDDEVVGGFWDGVPSAPGPRAVGHPGPGETGPAGDFTGPHWALDGNGSLAMSTRELATWTQALFTGRLVPPRALEVIRTPGVDLGQGRSATAGWALLDASVLGRPVVAAAGGGGDVGHEVVVAWLPEQQTVVAISSNGPDLGAEQLLRAVGRQLFAGDDLPRPSLASGRTGPAAEAAVAGVYELSTGGSFEARVVNGSLTLAATGADAVKALFPSGAGLTPSDLSAHEHRVLQLLAGRTREGRGEREALESAFGRISRVVPMGTVQQEGELRTYVSVTTSGRSFTAWYAVDKEGAMQGAEAPAVPPQMRFVPSGDGYRPFAPAGDGPDVTVRFTGGELRVLGPYGEAVAQFTE